MNKFVSIGLALLILVGSVSVVVADPPKPPPGQDAPPCHGQNNNDCRADPQPDKGKDCQKSEDHVCAEEPQPTATIPPVVSTPRPPDATPIVQPTTTLPPVSTPTSTSATETPTSSEDNRPGTTTPQLQGIILAPETPAYAPEAPAQLPKSGGEILTLLWSAVGLGTGLMGIGWRMRK